MMSEVILKDQWIFDVPRAERAPVSPVPHFAPLGSGAHSAPALAGWLLANAMRVRRSWGCGWVGQPQPQRPHQ